MANSTLDAPGHPSVSCSRQTSMWVSRAVIVFVVLGSLGTLFWNPVGWAAWAFDVLMRTYFNFVAGAMAHEGTHGHLGASRASNNAWGRLALLPTTVPYVTFRATHIAHHRYTNVPGKDPDEYLNTSRPWQFPLRAIAMPHHWLRWLARTGQLRREVVLEYLWTYAGYIAVYAAISAVVGPWRVLAGMLPAAILHSFVLWYPFARQTHQGYSRGSAETRSHNYFGRPAFWFSFGLSLHRAHHMWPNLGWLQMHTWVEPCSWWQALTFRRDIRLDVP